PAVVKPASGGSSVGVVIVNNETELKGAVCTAKQYDDVVVIEEYVKGREFSIGVIVGKALPIIEIIPKQGFYDYKNKYQAGLTEEICPANLNEEMTQIMQDLAEKAYKALDLEVYSRIDFILSEANVPYCLEANTLPGMTPTSLLPQEARKTGLEYEELCEKIIELSLKK
ncbi:MAG: ATP-grasp domain-containing protein, partial [Clostridia bacterium]|nr:ATP-grasp domain-containing protein [Clostridia bacterium]